MNATLADSLSEATRRTIVRALLAIAISTALYAPASSSAQAGAADSPDAILTGSFWKNHQDTWEFRPTGKLIQRGTGWEGKSWRWLPDKKSVEITAIDPKKEQRKHIYSFKDGVLIHWDPAWGKFTKEPKVVGAPAANTPDPQIARAMKGKWTLYALDTAENVTFNFEDNLRHSRTKWFRAGQATTKDGKLSFAGLEFDISKGVADELSGNWSGHPRKLMRAK
jgi:hypothetical protein